MQLSRRIEPQDDVLSLSGGPISPGDVIRIDDEAMLVTSTSDGTLTVVRGYGPTVPASHSVDAHVEWMGPSSWW